MTQLIASNQLTLTNVSDGQTAVIHWAYSDNADGTGFTTSDNGQRYMGHYSDFNQADSIDKTKYRWADRWAKIDVGGVNQISLTGASLGYRVGVSGENNPDSLHTVTKFIPVKYSNYVLSYDGELDSNTNYYYSLAWYSAPNVSGFISRPTGPAKQTDLINGIKLTPPANATYLRVSFPTNFNKVMLNGGTVKLNWSQSPEDIQSSINTKADQALTQEQINALNEQRGIYDAELKARATASELEEWVNAYNNYVIANDQNKKEAEASLISTSIRVADVEKVLGAMKERWNFILNYMDVSEDGLFFGKKDGSAEVRVYGDRISMFVAGNEVMYLSQDTINVNNGIFSTSIQIGRFKEEQYKPNPDINIIRYIR